MTPTIAQIQQAVATAADVPLTAILSKTRLRHIARPRQIAMWLSHEMTGLSYPLIGRVFDRDHTTVMHAVRRVETYKSGDKNSAIIENARKILEAVHD